jgi:hypothetical protein
MRNVYSHLHHRRISPLELLVSSVLAENAVAPWPQTHLPSNVRNACVLAFGYDACVAD